MIRWKSMQGNGRPLIGLGIEEGNVNRLKAGQPIMVDGRSLGIDVDIAIHYGATINDLIEQLRAAGVQLPEPIFRPANEPTN